MLQTRKTRVILVSANNEDEIKLSEEDISRGVEIEERIVEKVIEKHNEYLNTWMDFSQFSSDKK